MKELGIALAGIGIGIGGTLLLAYIWVIKTWPRF